MSKVHERYGRAEPPDPCTICGQFPAVRVTGIEFVVDVEDPALQACDEGTTVAIHLDD